MAECIILKAGGGTGSDDCTAIQEYVLEGYTAVTSDSDDEAIEGTMPYNRSYQMAEELSTSSTANELRARIPYGYYEKENYQGSILSPYIRMPYSNVRSAIGYTNSAKVLNDTTIAGLKGTMTNVASIDPAKSISLSNGVLYVRMTNGAHVTNATSGYPEVSIPQATLASGIGLTEAKIAKGQTILGKEGTYTSDATASAPYIRKGYTAYVNGNKITGSMSVPSLLSFSVAAYSTSQVVATWKNPANGPFGGVIIRWKTGSYPTSVTDGSGYKGGGNNTSANGTSSTTISGLSAGTTYYFRIWPYCDTSAGTIYGSTRDATCKVTAHGSQTFTASGTWTCPAGVRAITRAFLVGGGGAGGAGEDSGNSKPWYGGGGGGGGYTTTVKNISVNPGQKYAVVVGSGGTPQTSGTGGTSSIAGIASANGGTNCLGSYGEDGGSGAGSGGESGSSGSGGNGGSDGGDGARNAAGMVGGKGQGSTTRKFGESGNTLYAGGGGGGGGQPWPGGAGGSGGGGAGGAVLQVGANGGNNTGGGGGGGGVNYGSDEHKSGGKGGSGIVIIEW